MGSLYPAVTLPISPLHQVYEMWKDQERRHSIRPPMRPHADPVPMQTNTTYKQAYIEKPVRADIFCDDNIFLKSHNRWKSILKCWIPVAISLVGLDEYTLRNGLIG